MNAEKQARLKQLRARLADLTEQERQALQSRGLIATVEGRTLSLHNTLIVYLQSNGTLPSVVGGYHQWKDAGKQVRRGEHGFIIWFPVGAKDDDGEIIEDPQKFYTGTVFDISQVEAVAA